MKARAFNTVSIDSGRGVCTKSSVNTAKLQDEIYYYLNLPQVISEFFPRFIEYNEDYSSYQLEYLPYKTLSDLFLENKIKNVERKKIINKLLKILGKIHSVNTPIMTSKEDICRFYIKKTKQRIGELRKINSFKELLDEPSLKINGKNYKNFSFLENDFNHLLKNFSDDNYVVSAIHGDFCFSNILYLPNQGVIKLIDPRGSFTYRSIYGHKLYDYAKLMHCVHSGYDYIVNDQFKLQESSPSQFNYELPIPENLIQLEKILVQFLLEKNISLEFVYLIEASLFLSMASLHYENIQRQKIIYLTGIVLLNQVIEGKYANLH